MIDQVSDNRDRLIGRKANVVAWNGRPADSETRAERSNGRPAVVMGRQLNSIATVFNRCRDHRLNPFSGVEPRPTIGRVRQVYRHETSQAITPHILRSERCDTTTYCDLVSIGHSAYEKR